MTEDVPATLRPPVPLALAKMVESLPAEAALPGGSVYEPQVGCRMCALVGAGRVSLRSRHGKKLSKYSRSSWRPWWGRFHPVVSSMVKPSFGPGGRLDSEATAAALGRFKPLPYEKPCCSALQPLLGPLNQLPPLQQPECRRVSALRSLQSHPGSNSVVGVASHLGPAAVEVLLAR